MLETGLSLCLYLLLIIAVCFLFKKVTKIPVILLLPLSYIFLTFSLYVATLLSGNGIIIILIAVLLCIVLSFLFRNNVKSLKHHSISPLLVIVAFVITAGIAVARWSILWTSLQPETIYFPAVTDETKHVAVLTSIIAGNQSLPFPYNPTHDFPYYYLYYLLPAITLKLFTHAQFGLVWFAHVFLTQFAFFLTAIFVFSLISKRFILQLLGLLLSAFGMSLKFIPKVFDWYKNSGESHLERWYMVPSDKIFNQQVMTGWQITHPITVAVWTPQHEFAAMGVLLLYILLFHSIFNPPLIILIAILLTVIFGSSAFLGLGAILILAVYGFLYVKEKKRLVSIGLSLGLFILFIVPVYLLIRENQSAITFQPYIGTVPYITPFLGVPLFYLIETGLTLPLLVYLSYIAYKQKLFKNHLTMLAFLALATFIPLIISRLFQSAFNNDFSMRIPIFYTLFFPVFLIYLLEKIKLSRIMYKTIIGIIAISLFLAAAGGIYEIYFRAVKTESYPTISSRVYRVINRSTNPNDVLVTNDPFLADRIPVFSSRLVTKPLYPFSMNVYIPHNTKYKETKAYGKEMCEVYKAVKATNPSYHFVYAELASYPNFDCKEITSPAKKNPAIYDSGNVKVYRIN